jgi:regulator of RNase E activity RraA
VLVVLGMNLIDNCQLEAVAQAAAARNRWEFLVTGGAARDRERHRLADHPVALF